MIVSIPDIIPYVVLVLGTTAKSVAVVAPLLDLVDDEPTVLFATTDKVYVTPDDKPVMTALVDDAAIGFVAGYVASETLVLTVTSYDMVETATPL